MCYVQISDKRLKGCQEIIGKFFRSKVYRPEILSPNIQDAQRKIVRPSELRRIVRLVPVLMLETHNQTNNKCLPQFVQTDNASSSIKTAIFVVEVFDTAVMSENKQ